MKITILITCIVLHFCIIPKTSDGSELYFLNGNRVLLYKIINWWYYAPPDEGRQLCGDNLEYVNTGNAKMHYSSATSQMTIGIDGGFAPLLSVVKSCKACPFVYSAYGSLEGAEYLSGERPRLNIKESSFTNEYSLTIEGIDREMFETVRTWEDDLVFTLSGTVQGLQNGKIALGGAEDMLGKCHTGGDENTDQKQTFFTVSRSADGSVLMQFVIYADSRG